MDKKTILSQSSGINEFILAVKENRFVEAHELLEDEWRAYKKNGQKTEAKAVQGLINGATALALYFIKKRPNGYQKVWLVFEKYKPLLNEVKFENMEKYLEARDLLIKINSSIIKNKAHFS